jgi:hypothetical protein
MTTRPRAQIRADICEAIRLNQLHRRWYRKLKYGAAVISLLGGSAALATLIHPHPLVTAGAGIVVAVAGFIDILGDFSEKAARRNEYIAAYSKLLDSGLTEVQLEDGLQAVYRSVTDSDIEALRAVAHNDSANSMGWTHNLVRETLVQRLWRALA